MGITIELNDLVNLQNETTAVTQINQNSETIEGGFSTALNVTGDQMQGTLDLNSNQIINLPQPATANSPLRLQDLNEFSGGGTITNIPAGGSTGDSLVKASNIDYVVEWSPNTSDLTSGTNIVTSGANPTVISTVTSPVFTSVSMSSATVNTTLVNPDGSKISASGYVYSGGANPGAGNANLVTALYINGTNILSRNNILLYAPLDQTHFATLGYTSTVGNATITFPPVTDIVAVLGTAQTFTATQSFGAVNASTIVASTVTAAVPAGTLSGTTLAGNVVASSLASVGTITTGTWNATSISSAAGTLTGTTLAGNVVASSLTSVGVLSGASASAPIILPRYTVTSLPVSVTGALAVATDALAPTFLGALSGGGTTKVIVLYNGSAWVAA